MKKDKKTKKSTKKKKDEKQIVIINNIKTDPEPPNLRTVQLYGDIVETKAADVIAGLLYLENTALTQLPPGSLEPQTTESSEETMIVSQNINMVISTNGGIASDMFSIIDVMELIKKRTCDIETYGVGKVMSAGVPILAAGTKGKRKIGKNCRIMIHNVSAGTIGSVETMENEIEEIKWTQDSYIECLSKYTKLTKAKIKKLLKTQKNVYISAEEAIKMGIVDEII